jgi:hypothetical protein
MRAPCRATGLLFGLTGLAAGASAEVAGDGSRLPGTVSIEHTTRLAHTPATDDYTHYAAINAYLTREHAPSLTEIRRQLARAQGVFDACRIQLRLVAVHQVAAPALFAEWESLEFNTGLSPWERALFSLTAPFSAGIVYVEQVDWTIGRDGIIAVGYGPFVVTDTEHLKSAQEQDFFRQRVAGHAVLGKSSGPWTLGHELGHAVLGLRHSERRDNIMFSGQLARTEGARLEEWQCAAGRANAPWVLPIGTTVVSHAAAVLPVPTGQ